MTFDEKANELFNGKYFLMLSWLAMVIGTVVAAGSGEVVQPVPGQGIFYGSLSFLSGSTMTAVCVNLLLVTVIGALLQLLNKVYSFVRNVTDTLAGSFYLLTMANPLTCGILQPGTALALVLVLGAFYVFSSYSSLHAQHRVFLVFAAVTFATMFQWSFALLLPVFFLGFCYMRVMNWRGLAAMLFGLFVPFWIILGLGLASPSDFKALLVSTVWQTLDLSQVRMLVVSVAVTAVATVGLIFVNMPTIINYRRQLRVFNVFFWIVAILAVVAMLIDYRDMHVFLPLLNLCLAVQVAHAFTISRHNLRYVYVVVLIVWSLCSHALILYV